MLTIDGSQGEGGGQILRTALALSLVTGTAFRLEKIRAGRRRPGLMRQHLASLRAATQVGRAEVAGDVIGSQLIEFRPKSISAGQYSFAIGSAGSTTLVFQTVLPALFFADGPTSLTLEGGTHNPSAPPFDFLDRAFVPLLRRMGATITLALLQPGFYPAGGGQLLVQVEPNRSLRHLEILDRGEIKQTKATAFVAQLPSSIALREIDTLVSLLGWDRSQCRPYVFRNSRGPGNVLVAEVHSENLSEVFTGFGEKGVAAEQVARHVADEVTHYLHSDIVVGEHLADQLILPMALGQGGVFRTGQPTSHLRTQIDIVRMFLDVPIELVEQSDGHWLVKVVR